MKNIPHIIIVILFFGLLLLPQIFDRCMEFDRSIANENRNLTQLPKKFKYSKIASELEAYYNDRIPFRSILLNGCSIIQNHLFSFTMGELLIGEKGFYFYRKPGWEDPVDQFRGKEKLRKYDLLKAERFLTTLNKHLEKNNIDFLMVIAPNKVQVYPEYLPERRKYTESLLMPDIQLCHFMQQRAPQIPILHLRQYLLQAKKHYNENLYYKLDSHWGLVGGYIGAREIIRHFDHRAELPAAGDFTIVPSGKNEPGDLRNLALRKTECPVHPEMKPDVPEFTGKIDGIDKGYLYSYNPDAPDKRRVLMYRDSFAFSLMPYISLHFQEVYYVRSHDVSLQYIEKVKPDILILEYVARVIGRMKTKIR